MFAIFTADSLVAVCFFVPKSNTKHSQNQLEVTPVPVLLTYLYRIQIFCIDHVHGPDPPLKDADLVHGPDPPVQDTDLLHRSCPWS